MTAAPDQADGSALRGAGFAGELQPRDQIAEVPISPAVRGFSLGVRGGTRRLTTRLKLDV